MANYTILGRELDAVLNNGISWDLLVVRIDYKNRSIINKYRIGKDERIVPRRLMRDRKFSTTTVDGKPWFEGKVKEGFQ